MSRSDIICAIALLSFVSLCFGGISTGAIWTVAVAPQGTPASANISNGFAAFAGLVGAFVCIFLSVGLWRHPDHDAVLGCC